MDKDDKLTLFLMRDTGEVRRYQFRRMWFNLFLYAQAVLFGVSFSGSYGTYFLWSRQMELINNNSALQEQTSELQMHLERLQYAQEILTTGEREFPTLFRDGSLLRENRLTLFLGGN